MNCIKDTVLLVRFQHEELLFFNWMKVCIHSYTELMALSIMNKPSNNSRLYIIIAILLSAILMTSCSKEETVTYKVSYVTDTKAQDTVNGYERYHMSCVYYHNIPQGTDSASIMQMFVNDWGTDDIIYESYAYCLDKDYGSDTRIEYRSNMVNPYELQYHLGLLDSNYHFIN